MSDKPMFERTIFDGYLMHRAANEDGSMAVCAFSGRRTMLTFGGDGYSFSKFMGAHEARALAAELVAAADVIEAQA